MLKHVDVDSQDTVAIRGYHKLQPGLMMGASSQVAE